MDKGRGDSLERALAVHQAEFEKRLESHNGREKLILDQRAALKQNQKDGKRVLERLAASETIR